MTDPDQAALLQAIHDAHSQELLRYVLRLTRGDMPFAEDVVQESLLRLWRKPEVLQQCADEVRAWLFTVARNLVIDDRRSARYARELQTEYVPERSSPDAIGPAFDKWILSDALHVAVRRPSRRGRPGLLPRPERRRHRRPATDSGGNRQVPASLCASRAANCVAGEGRCP